MIRAAGRKTYSRTDRTRSVQTGTAQSGTRGRVRQNAAYIHGSAAPARDFWEETIPAQDNIPVETRIAVRSNRESFVHMTPRLVLYFFGMTVLMAAILVSYIKLRSDVTTSTSEVVVLENQLSELRSENDETLKAIESSIDLEQIRERAVKELGMTYATRDQIVEYTDKQEEVVHPVTDVQQ